MGQLQAADYGRVRQSHSQRYDEQFIYDVTGNRVSSQSRDSSPGNRLAFYGDRHFGYDKLIRLIHKAHLSGQHNMLFKLVPDKFVVIWSLNSGVKAAN